MMGIQPTGRQVTYDVCHSPRCLMHRSHVIMQLSMWNVCFQRDRAVMKGTQNTGGNGKRNQGTQDINPLTIPSVRGEYTKMKIVM